MGCSFLHTVIGREMVETINEYAGPLAQCFNNMYGFNIPPFPTKRDTGHILTESAAMQSRTAYYTSCNYDNILQTRCDNFRLYPYHCSHRAPIKYVG